MRCSKGMFHEDSRFLEALTLDQLYRIDKKSQKVVAIKIIDLERYFS